MSNELPMTILVYTYTSIGTLLVDREVYKRLAGSTVVDIPIFNPVPMVFALDDPFTYNMSDINNSTVSVKLDHYPMAGQDRLLFRSSQHRIILDLLYPELGESIVTDYRERLIASHRFKQFFSPRTYVKLHERVLTAQHALHPQVQTLATKEIRKEKYNTRRIVLKVPDKKDTG